MARPNTIELWRGESALTGDPIVALASCLARPSRNDKTGDMIQTWILRQDMSPIRASAEDMDDAVCGDCKFRAGNGCYVALRSPQAVWKTWKAGNVPAADHRRLQGNFARKPIRLGAYGDPAAVPLNVWINAIIATGTLTWTGYTHAWKTCDQEFRKWVMASVDTIQEQDAARLAGWKCFRTVPDDTMRVPHSILCPAHTRGVTCAECGLCRGTQGSGKDIIMPIHGYQKKKALKAIAV